MKKTLLSLAVFAALAPAAHAAGPVRSFEKIWTFTHGTGGSSPTGQTSEIVSFDAGRNELWVVGLKGVDILNAANGSFVQHIDTSMFGEANSVAVRNGVAAIALQAATQSDPGLVKVFNTATRSLIESYTVGAQPDHVGFTPDGRPDGHDQHHQPQCGQREHAELQRVQRRCPRCARRAARQPPVA
jgi:hypothetical protein